jgi:predicted PurR-regulated permease PerM
MEQAKAGHARTVAQFTVAAVLLVAAWAAADVLLLLFGAIVFSLPIGWAADWLSERTPLTRGLALAVVFVTLVLFVGGAGWLLAGQVAEQVQRLSETLPKSVAHLSDRLRDREWGRQLIDSISRWQAGPGRGDVFGRITGIFSSGLGVIANALIVLIGTLYLAADPRLYRGGLVRLFPPENRSRVQAALAETGSTLRSWLLAKVALMTFVGVATTLGLGLLGMPMVVALGLLAGLLNFIPNFGPLIAFIPAALIAVTIEPILVVWLALLYYGIQAVENYVLTPIVQRHAAKLAPAVIIFSQIALGVLFGGLGLLFAEPLAAAAQVLIKRLYVDVREEAASQAALPDHSLAD